MRSTMKIPPTRAVAAAAELRRRILEGTYPGGMQLRQEALSAEFGISRIPLREALVQLEAEGLIKNEAHKGAIVAPLSLEDIEELFEFRALIEPKLLLKSAPKLTESDFEALHEILREFSEELRTDHVGRWGELNFALHSALYQRADSPRMMAVATQLLQGADRLTRIELAITDRRPQSEAQHQDLVDLCERGDFRTAATLLKDHILGGRGALLKELRARQRIQEHVEK
jgi:DNA-binding GntR family transcriptional regulator